jgi:ubiquinone/menaquinone biosynthesis C-methylase UbiE
MPYAKKLYWNLRAHDIHDKWGEGRNDFSVIRRVVDRVKPATLLDIGCGSGRCFSLYQEMHIPVVVGQDISSNALEICKKKHPELQYQIVCCDITKLPFKENHFDLIISTRVLAAVSTKDIADTMSTLCLIGHNIYLNEMTESDYNAPSTYWFKHNYDIYMRDHNFLVSEKGIISVVENGQTHEQTWVLYTKK